MIEAKFNVKEGLDHILFDGTSEEITKEISDIVVAAYKCVLSRNPHEGFALAAAVKAAIDQEILPSFHKPQSEVGGWISVFDELPKFDKEVWVVVRDGDLKRHVARAKYSPHYGWSTNLKNVPDPKKTTHWKERLPLPVLPPLPEEDI